MKNYFLEGAKEGYDEKFLYSLYHRFVSTELENLTHRTDTEIIERIKDVGLQLDEALEFIENK